MELDVLNWGKVLLIMIMLAKTSFKNQSRYDSESSDFVFALSHTPSNNAVVIKSRNSGEEILM